MGRHPHRVCPFQENCLCGQGFYRHRPTPSLLLGRMPVLVIIHIMSFLADGDKQNLRIVLTKDTLDEVYHEFLCPKGEHAAGCLTCYSHTIIRNGVVTIGWEGVPSCRPHAAPAPVHLPPAADRAPVTTCDQCPGRGVLDSIILDGAAV